MFAASFLAFSLVFSAFFLAFFAVVDRLTFILSTSALFLAVAQDESAAKLSAFVADNTLEDVSHFLTAAYDVTETPDSTCAIDAGEMLALYADNEAAREKAGETPVIQAVQVKALTVEDVEIAAGWQAYRRYAAFAADFSPVIRPEARYVASENTAFDADNAEVDDWYAQWSGATG